MALKLIVVRAQPTAEAVLLGALDAESGAVLQRKTDALLADGYLAVELDLSAITGVDDDGIAALARTRQQFREHAGRLTLHGLTPEATTQLKALEAIREVAADESA